MPTIKYREKFNKNSFEIQAWQKNQFICGIDEVGRGCLAGPVVTAAAILLPGKKHPLLKDSKLMTKKELFKAYTWLKKNSWSAVAIVHNRDIDRFNIYYATLRAMRRAVLQLFIKGHIPSTILVDAMPLNLSNTAYQDMMIYHFPFGERKSSSIAAASIIAKVTRDTIMAHFNSCLPGYHLDSHVGYSTKSHQKAIKEKGKTIIHRSSYVDGKHWLDEQPANLSIDFIDPASQLDESYL